MSDYVSREDHEDRVAQINAHRMDLQDRIEAQAAEIARLRSALHSIVQLDHHNHGAPSASSQIARQALGEQP